MDMELAASRDSRYTFRHGFLTLFLAAAVVGIPLAWRKLRGGVNIDWIGYVLFLSSYAVGISERRAQWCVRWCRRMREGRHVNTAELEEGLGRLCFVAGILDYPRPWLAPIYAYLSTVPLGVVRTLPLYTLLALRYLEHAL